MPPRHLTASERFDKLYRELLQQQSHVVRALKIHAKSYLRKKHVVGFGAGRRFGEFVPVFFVDKKVPERILAPKDRLPRWVKVGRKNLRTDVIAVGAPADFTEPVGDPTDNRKSYRVNGNGDWQMGTKIQIFANHGIDVKGSGTSGARVRSIANPGEPPLAISCAHVLKVPGWDVAQADENRKIPKPLNNFVGGVKKVLDGKIDAGSFECAGALQEVLHVGKPKPPQKPLAGMYVQKSGAATGLTYGKILAVGQKKAKVQGKWAEQDGVFLVENSCPQNPRDPSKLPAGVPDGRFAWHGDSGSLILLGKPGNPALFGETSLGLQHEYDIGSAAEKQKIVDEKYGAALGLLIAGSDDTVYGQDIELVLGALKVRLDT